MTVTKKTLLSAALALTLALGLCSCTQTQTSAEEEEPEEPAFTALVEESEPVDPSWFSDAVFIGDSISVMLETYNDTYGTLGSPTFLCSVGLSQTNALTYSAGAEGLPEYPEGSGAHPKLADAVAQSGATKVFLMLGMNCLSGGVDRAATDLVTLIGEIRAQSPDVAVLIQSVTPMTASSPRTDDSLNNTVISAFNARMEEICNQEGWYYINTAQALSDENGYLRDDYSGDKAMGIHMNYNGAEVWASYLLSHVPEALK